MDKMIKLDVLTDEITGEICATRCGSKCCNFKLSDHFVPIEIVDYENLARIGGEKFVSFYPSLESPQLIHKTNGKCVFLREETGLCSIYEFRPLACRNYPYRESEKEEADLPDWCELFHRSSEKLELERINQAQDLLDKYYNNQRMIDPDNLMKYLEFERSNVIFEKHEFELSQNIANTNLFAKLETTSQEFLNLAKANLDMMIETSDKDWKVVYVMIYNHDFEIVGKIEAVFRKNEQVQIPYLQDFPPTYDEYDRLYGIIMGSDDYKDNSISGGILPDEFDRLLEENLEGKKPINSEFQ